jgi:opacity protein-like surface antigen
MRTDTLVVSLCLVAVAPLTAQTTDSLRIGPPFGWYVTLGSLRADWAHVQPDFTTAGYAALPRDLFQLGGGFYVVTAGMMIGVDGYALLSERQTSGTRELRTTAGAGFLTLGLPLVNRPRARFYPMGGIGGAGLRFRIDQAAGSGVGPDANNPTFLQVLRDPGQVSRMTAGSLALTAGVGLDIVPAGLHRGRRGGTHGFMLGLRAGYQWTPYTSDWRMYDLRIIGGPTQLMSGWYVRAAVGGSGRPVLRPRRARDRERDS